MYNISLEETKKAHQLKQLELVKAASSGLELYINQLANDLEYFSKFPPTKKYFNQYYQYQIRKEVVQSVFGITSEGQLDFYFGKKIANNTIKSIDSLISIDNSNSNICLFSDVINIGQNKNSDSLVFFMIIPKETINKADALNFYGFMISFDWLINKFIAPLKLSKNDFAWVLDDKGRLIYHPHHEEMLFRSITDFDYTCSECHDSFDIQKKILKSKTNMDEYFIIGEPKKIMASTQVNLNNKIWVLAISTYLPSVIAGVKNNYYWFFILSGISIILIVVMATTLLKINLKRIRAEESSRFLEQSRSFQEKINHAAKLASIGELVDNVAHEINTPTGIISAETDVLFLKECEPQKCCEELSIIKEQTKRIKNYTRSLLNYSRRMPFLPEENDIAELIDECLFLVSPRIRANQILIRKNICENIPKIIFDKGRIEQVVINILNNAIDSIKEKKEITISVEIKKEDEKNDSDQNIILSISDKGQGITKENLSKIFEPFFSTKSADLGTGLGLSISKAIIKLHNGDIWVESEINNGTTFFISLPVNNNNLL